MEVNQFNREWEISICREDIQNITYKWMVENKLINPDVVSIEMLKFDFGMDNVLPVNITVKL